MAISDYDSLRDEVSTWCARSDTTFRNRFETFLELAEDRIYNGAGDAGDPLQTAPLRSQVMQATGTVTLASGTGALPTDLLELRSIHPSGNEVGIDYLPPERFDVAQAAVTGSYGLYYEVVGSTLNVHPGITGDINIAYFKRFDAINSDNKTGTLLTEHAPIYLSALLFEAYSWMEEVDTALAHLARYRSQVAGANRTAHGKRYGAQSRRIRPRQPIS